MENICVTLHLLHMFSAYLLHCEKLYIGLAVT